MAVYRCFVGVLAQVCSIAISVFNVMGCGALNSSVPVSIVVLSSSFNDSVIWDIRLTIINFMS